MLKLVGKREVLGNAINVGGMDGRGFAEAAQALRILGLGQMAASGARAQYFARSGDFEPFGDRFLRFDAFGTSHS
jgi:hypothetical protein